MATATITVYIERGSKRSFAGALDWPGWCRSDRTPEAALQALADYGPRYAKVLEGSGLTFQLPADLAAFTVVEEVEGNATTDFGAPNIALSLDHTPVDPATLADWQTILQSCWRAFDRVRAAADGKALRTGPRGGGRDMAKMIEHVCGGDAAYLSRLAWKLPRTPNADPDELLQYTRQAIGDALAAAVQHGLPTHGPRGGTLWAPRTFVRRVAWHVLDHTWEVEDRIM